MALITLLDGGMGQELVARSGDEPTPLWATRVMIDHPGMAGAEIRDDLQIPNFILAHPSPVPTVPWDGLLYETAKIVK